MNSILRLALSVAFIAMTYCAVADTPVANARLELTVANLAGALDPLITDWIDKYKGPGAVVVVVKRDGPVFAKGYGFSDIEANKPFTADTTLVRPGSISKLFTGIAVMQLVDAGKLDLDLDVNAYLDFSIPTPEGGVPVTLRRLLTHRAGFEEHGKGLFSKDREPEPLGHWLAKNLPPRLFPQGDVAAYSNYGVSLAGYIVERVSGEPYPAYIQRHILGPLGMSHSTFQQPLPSTLAPLMAKGYRRSDAPPLPFFEAIRGPAGGLSASGADMGRFIRALMNGGELNGVRILPKARLDEMLKPSSSATGDFLGLVFVGTKVAGHNVIGHNGGTMAFFSDLKYFPEQDLGIFVAFDGLEALKEPKELPEPARVIAERFLPKAQEQAAARTSLANDASVDGIYFSSRRAESSFVKLTGLASQFVIRTDSARNARVFFALWPFGDGKDIKHLGQNLYEFPGGARFTFMDGEGSEPYFSWAAIHMQRVPWSLDARWIVPALLASTAIVFLTLLAWPINALWRRWRKKPWSQDLGELRKYRTVKLVLLVDAAVIIASAVLWFASEDFTILNDALDPLLIALYAFAWLGVLGVIPTLWIASEFCRNGIGSQWMRIHLTLIAASSLMIAWFFITFHIAGTTLNY